MRTHLKEQLKSCNWSVPRIESFEERRVFQEGLLSYSCLSLSSSKTDRREMEECVTRLCELNLAHRTCDGVFVPSVLPSFTVAQMKRVVKKTVDSDPLVILFKKFPSPALAFFQLTLALVAKEEWRVCDRQHFQRLGSNLVRLVANTDEAAVNLVFFGNFFLVTVDQKMPSVRLSEIMSTIVKVCTRLGEASGGWVLVGFYWPPEWNG